MVSVRRFGRFNHFFIRCIRVSIADIFLNRAGKQKRLLRNVCNLPADFFQRVMAERFTLKQDISAVHRIKTRATA